MEALLLNARLLTIRAVLVPQEALLGIDAFGKAVHGIWIYNDTTVFDEKGYRRHGCPTGAFVTILSSGNIALFCPGFWFRIIMVCLLTTVKALVEHWYHLSNNKVWSGWLATTGSVIKTDLIISDSRGYFNVKS